MAMPPELISLTALDFECKFEHVEIPMDVTASYVEEAPESRQVGADEWMVYNLWFKLGDWIHRHKNRLDFTLMWASFFYFR